MHQQQLENKTTTTTQQMQHDYACGTNRASSSLRESHNWTCQTTTPFSKVIFDLSGYNPLRLTMLMQRHNLNAMTSTS